MGMGTGLKGREMEAGLGLAEDDGVVAPSMAAKAGCDALKPMRARACPLYLCVADFLTKQLKAVPRLLARQERCSYMPENPAHVMTQCYIEATKPFAFDSICQNASVFIPLLS